MDVLECEDGAVIIRYGDEPLGATAVRKGGNITQQDVESNKSLGRILEHVRNEQLARDEETLRSRKVTLRQKNPLRLDILRRTGSAADREAPPPARFERDR